MTAASAIPRPAGAEDDVAFRASTGRRFFDTANAAWMVKVFPGEYYVTSQPDEILVTVLGSCVSACVRDPVVGVGGMNHFMLAQGHSSGWGDDPKSTRYGNFAMEKLINELLKAGCARERLEIKVFGGGNVTDTKNAIGTDNAEFVMRYLGEEGLRCSAKDLGGTQPRRIHYFPVTGRVTRRMLGTSDLYAVTREEHEYANQLRSQPVAGEIQLFGE